MSGRCRRGGGRRDKRWLLGRVLGEGACAGFGGQEREAFSWVLDICGSGKDVSVVVWCSVVWFALGVRVRRR